MEERIDGTIKILIDEQGYCQFVKAPDRWHWCDLSDEQIEEIMDILKKAEKARIDENSSKKAKETSSTHCVCNTANSPCIFPQCKCEWCYIYQLENAKGDKR